MARKENQMMMNDNIQVTLSKSQFEEQLLQLRSTIESQQFPRHCIVAAFEQLKTAAKSLFARREHNNNQQILSQSISGTSKNTNFQDGDSHLLKLFQDISQQVALIQLQMQNQSVTNLSTISIPSKQIFSSAVNNHSFSNNIWEGEKHSFDSGSTVSYFHDETKVETGDEHLFQGFFEDDHNSDSQNQRLNSSGSNSCNNTQMFNIDNINQSNFRSSKFFPPINSQNNMLTNQWGDIFNEQKYNVQDSIINTSLITPFTKHIENKDCAQQSILKEKKGSNFQDASAEEFYDDEEDEQKTDKLKQPLNTKSFSSNSLKGMITSNNIGPSSITNIKKGKKANLMHNLKTQLKKANCCNFDTNDDEDEEDEEYEEYSNYYKLGEQQQQQNSDGKPNIEQGNQEINKEEDKQEIAQNMMQNNQPPYNSEKSQENLFQTNQFDFRLFDQHHQKINFPIEGRFKGEEEEEDQEESDIDLSKAQDFRQLENNQNSLMKSQIVQDNTCYTGQISALQQHYIKQQQQNNICDQFESKGVNYEAQDDHDYENSYQNEEQEGEVCNNYDDEEEEYDDGYEDEDETYNANLDVVGQRESFQQGERLNFMASQRIHYYKMDDFNEILNERNPTYEQHCENMRNIIMTMSNNYGGLIMFGLGKNKIVQGISLNTKERQDFIKFITNIKNSIHNSKQLFCKVSYFPIYRLNSQSQALPPNNPQQKDNLQSPFNQQVNIKPQAPTTNITSHFKLFDQVPPADFSLFTENPTPSQSCNTYPPLLLFDSDSQTEQDLLFTPFCTSVDPKKNLFSSSVGANTFYNGGAQEANKIESSFQQNWNCPSSNWSLETSQSSKRKGSGDTKQWVVDRYVIRVFVDQGQKLDATYVYIKNKEITSAIYDKKLKIFKPIYGEPLLNKILSKAQSPSIQAQKLNLSEPEKEGLLASSIFSQPLQQAVQQQISLIPQEQQFNLQNYTPFSGCSSLQQNQEKFNQNFGLVSSINPPGIPSVIKAQKTIDNPLSEEASLLLVNNWKNEDISKEIIGTNSPPLTQEYIKRKRGEKILNDSKKRQIKEKNQRYQQGEEKNIARKSQQHLSHSSKSQSRESCTTLSDEFKTIPIVKYNLIEFIGFEHSDNAKSFRALIEKQIGNCLVECGIAKYDTLFFKVSDQLQLPSGGKEQVEAPNKQLNKQLGSVINKKVNQIANVNNNNSFISIGLANNSNNNSEGAGYFNNNSNNNLSLTDKQYEWMEKLCNYLMSNDNWRDLISKERIFKKLAIDGQEYFTEESNQWLCFQNVKNKNNFTSQIAQLQQKSVIERVNLYHQHVFIINKQKEFEKFCATNKQFQQCFLSDVIKKGYSNSNILVKSLKNSHRGQESFKQLLNSFKFTITQQGSNFFVCQFQSPLESFLAMERLINHRKQKFILDLFNSNALDAVIELQDNPLLNPQQQLQQEQQQ